jgi:hypothetical protein
MERFEAAGVTLIALSYDEPDALEAFAEYAGITFPLLSDPDSEVIRGFGILNTLIAEDDHPWFGIPFPGTYVTDADGVITAKFFENNLALRPGVDLLLQAALGEDVSDELVAIDREPVGQVEVSFDLDDGPVGPGTMRELRVHLRVPEGQHLYGEPVAEGMVATAVEIDDADSLLIVGTEAPPTTPHTLATGETLQIYEGDVTLRARFSHNGRDIRPGGENEMSLTGRVRYQSCDNDACGLPGSEPFDLTVQLAPISRTRFGNAKEGDMDSLPYLKDMMRRRK